MNRGFLLKAWIGLTLLGAMAACDRELEEPTLEMAQDYMPLTIGKYWVYDVLETIYYGENDSEQSSYQLRDKIRSVYINDASEQVFVVARSKSTNQLDWVKLYDYTLIVREGSLVRTIQNQPIVVLAANLTDGQVWDGNLYWSEQDDEFYLERLGQNSIKVDQENEDDLITFRDIRYESYEKGVGMTELYAEVLTYCSRNDCLGDQLIDSGSKIQMNLINHGEE